jgi:hypothetical protein
MVLIYLCLITQFLTISPSSIPPLFNPSLSLPLFSPLPSVNPSAIIPLNYSLLLLWCRSPIVVFKKWGGGGGLVQQASGLITIGGVTLIRCFGRLLLIGDFFLALCINCNIHSPWIAYLMIMPPPAGWNIVRIFFLGGGGV